MIILSDNPLAVPPEATREIRNLVTFDDGFMLYRADDPFAQTICAELNRSP